VGLMGNRQKYYNLLSKYNIGDSLKELDRMPYSKKYNILKKLLDKYDKYSYIDSALFSFARAYKLRELNWGEDKLVSYILGIAKKNELPQEEKFL
jgi:hypothetical protein